MGEILFLAQRFMLFLRVWFLCCPAGNDKDELVTRGKGCFILNRFQGLIFPYLEVANLMHLSCVLVPSLHLHASNSHGS